MNFCALILTIGIPGSGKSTWVKDTKSKYPGVFVVSTDEIRKELTGDEQCNPAQNIMIHDEAKKRVKVLIDDKKNICSQLGTWPVIIVDSTNVDVEEWIAYKQLGADLFVAQVFDCSVDEAMKKMENRERKVDRAIVEWKWRTLEKNKASIPKLFDNVSIVF